VRYGDDDDDKHEDPKVELDDLPEITRKVLVQQSGKAKIDRIVKRREAGVDVYQADWKTDGLGRRAKVTVQGVLVEVKEDLADKDVPPFIRAASSQAFRKGTKLLFQRRKLYVYMVVAEIKGRKRRVMIAPTGRLLVRR